MDSILLTIKKQLGPGMEETHFDPDIMLLINSAFSRLHELGVGPEEPFIITGDSEIWDEFATYGKTYSAVQEFVYLYVKLIFDPPQSSFIYSAYKERLDKLEWTLNSALEVVDL